MTQFTSLTYRYFTLFVNQFNPPFEIIQHLIFTCRYSKPVHFENVFQETIQAFDIYYNFAFDPADIDIINPSPSLDIPFTTTVPKNNLFESSEYTSSN